MMRIILLCAALGFSVTTWAQTGTIKGNVKDAKTGESVIGANVLVAGTANGAAADIDGNFEIPKVKPGTYTLIVSLISYKTDTVKNVVVEANQATVINAVLAEETKELNEVIVTGLKLNDNDISIISEIRKNDLVAVGISAQQISLSQDRDAAQVIKRIPGVTILNNRFVNVRGLNERYSTVMLNGVIAPSSEVDSKAFAFDLIPSNMIDRMMVFKSGSSELPGEFAGAAINIESKGATDENSISVNVTTGIRLGTTFKDFNTYKGSNTDWLGYDNGMRQLPGYFPAANLRSITSTENATAISRSLPNIWGIESKTAAPDYRMTVNFSRTSYLGQKRFSNITSLNYSNTRQRIDQENYYYDAYLASANYRRYKYNDIRDIENVRFGLISNFILELNHANRIEFRNLFSQQGSSQTTLRTGIEDAQGVDVNNRALNYQSRSIYSGQLSGKHDLNEKLNLNWIMGYSMTYADQPDYRRIRSQRPAGSTDEFTIQIPPNASTLDAGRFYSKLVENVYTHALNAQYKLNDAQEEKEQSKLMAGYYVSYTDRSFNARWFSYKWNSLTNRPQSILNAAFEDIFVPQNVGAYDGDARPPYFILEEGTNFSDRYQGKNMLAAGYVNATIPFGDFRLSTGVRTEYNRQQLNSFQTDGTDVNVDNPVTSILPSGNLSYNLNEKSLVRLAYGKTVNRPVLRELAPFNFYDFDRNANLYGNPDLKIANIHNVDLRWESYPSESESIMIGTFYKYFNNPIEMILTGGSNLLYTFKNAESARTFGAEIELRKSLKGLTSNNLLNNISVLFNAAWINSEIDLGSVDNQARKRAMQGQSPYILNTGLYYNNYETGWQVNVSHNIYGPRIYAVGDDLNATQFELPRHQLDLTVSKQFRERWEVKFGIQDILNQSVRLKQDTDGDIALKGIKDPIQSFKPGQYVSLGLTCKL
ncbi:MAG: carboxypeptidase-like regulatory domain-containing protein [Bacteroidota bacterium]